VYLEKLMDMGSDLSRHESTVYSIKEMDEVSAISDYSLSHWSHLGKTMTVDIRTRLGIVPFTWGFECQRLDNVARDQVLYPQLVRPLFAMIGHSSRQNEGLYRIIEAKDKLLLEYEERLKLQGIDLNIGK
jgi:XLF-Cernunnos, XRcc4-like factor, NHEJ component